MKKLISQSLWLPLLYFREILQAFWPVITLDIIYNLFIQIREEPLTIYGFNAGLFVWLFLAFMYISGAVNWHRMLLINKNMERVKLFPEMREFKYFLRLMLLSLYTVLMGTIPILVFTFSYVSKVQTVEEFNDRLYVILLVSLPVIMIFSVYFLAKKFVSLAAVSIDGAEIDLSDDKKDKFDLEEHIPGNVAMGFFWSITPGIVLSVFVFLSKNIPFLGEFIRVMSVFLGIFTGLYGMLAYTAILSLVYRDNVLPDLKKQVGSKKHTLEF